MENRNKSAFGYGFANEQSHQEVTGLSKREYAAIMAMQATDLEAYANAFGKDWAKKVSEDAILLADELLKQLENK
jgi:hypothetical protein